MNNIQIVYLRTWKAIQAPETLQPEELKKFNSDWWFFHGQCYKWIRQKSGCCCLDQSHCQCVKQVDQVTQEVLLKLQDHFQKTSEPVKHPASYLKKICWNTFMDSYRNRGSFPRNAAIEYVDELQAVEGQIAAAYHHAARQTPLDELIPDPSRMPPDRFGIIVREAIKVALRSKKKYKISRYDIKILLQWAVHGQGRRGKGAYIYLIKHLGYNTNSTDLCRCKQRAARVIRKIITDMLENESSIEDLHRTENSLQYDSIAHQAKESRLSKKLPERF